MPPVTLSNENAPSRFRPPPHPHPPPFAPQQAAHGQPGADVTMASAGIRKSPSGRYKVWWRLDDGSQDSQALASRDQARDYMHELLAGVARDTWVHPRRGKQPFGEWARQWWETWSSDPDRSPTTLEATEARFRLHVLPYFEHDSCARSL
jgi:Phage integrase, N-terminal SAM-like domain